jgi:uncharacterized protein
VRFRLFEDPQRQRWWIARLLGFGLGGGVLFHAVAVVAFLQGNIILTGLCHSLGALPMALGYLGLVLAWAQSGPGAWLQARLREVGRLALSNYLLQSVICAFLFYRYGLRLYGQIDAMTMVGIMLGIWVVEVALTHAWLRFYRMGPVEWAWRSLAEGRRLPLRRVEVRAA